MGLVAERESSVSSETRERVVEMYLRGEKLADIEAAAHVPRATIYMILRQAEIAPQRMQMRTRINEGDPVATIEWAFNKMLEQERLIAQLQGDLEKANKTIERLKKRLGS